MLPAKPCSEDDVARALAVRRVSDRETAARRVASTRRASPRELRSRVRERAGCSRSAARGVRTTARRGRGRRASAGRASAPASGGSTSRSLPLSTGSLGGIGSSSRNSKISAQHGLRVADELLVLEDVHPLEVLAVGLEERVAAEPVLEHPVVAPRAAPPRGRDRDRDGVADDDDERGAREERLQEAGLEQVRRRLLEQHRPGEIPVRRPLLEQLQRVLLGDERRVLGQVRLRREAEPARPRRTRGRSG